MTLQMGLTLSALLFVLTHFLLSHPLRGPCFRRGAEGPFREIYSLVALVTFGGMIYFYGKIGREPPLWQVGDAGWIVGSLVVWLPPAPLVGGFFSKPPAR